MEQSISNKSLVGNRPMVSVILAIYNEARCIEAALRSILKQQTFCPAIGEFDVELLAIDGMSDDGTRQILDRVAAQEPRLRVVVNERRRTPFAFNLGLLHAKGEYVCIFGAHSAYREDYIATCLGELLARGAAGCGGRVITMPASRSLSARLCSWALSHPFGSSRKSFRTQAEGSVDTVNYPVLRRDLVLAAGGYDEELTRNQDNDLNQKLRAGGHILWCTWKTECLYYPKSTVKGLLRYAYGNGFWNVLSLRKNPKSMGMRHFVPMAFVLCVLLGAMIAAVGAFFPAPSAYFMLLPLFALLALHLAFGTLSAFQVALRERSPGALYLPAVFLGLHVAYGYGTLACIAGQGVDLLIPRMRQRSGAPNVGD
jgi:glycosyltransferase involved in cell wall biosynthesis